MFIGHYGVALAAKRFAPESSLGTLIFAAQLLDLLWPIFLLLGVEHVAIVPGITKASPFDFTDYPYSHSLATSLLWAILVGGAYYALRRYQRGAWVIGVAVVSHWLLDLIVHRPDLLLRPGGETRVGLGLWNSWAATIVVEVVFFAAGLWAYLSTTRARDAAGRYALWSLIALLFIGWIASMLAGAPPNVNSIAWGGLSMWLMVPWGWWADKHSEVVR